MSCERNVAASRGFRRCRAAVLVGVLWCLLIPMAPEASAQSFEGDFEVDNDIRFFTFTVLSDSSINTDSWNNDGEGAPSGFDPVINIFRADGTFFATRTQSSTFDRNPEFFFSESDAGTYFVALTQFDNVANAGESEGGSIDDGFTRNGDPGDPSDTGDPFFTSTECDASGLFFQIGNDCIQATSFYRINFFGMQNVREGLPDGMGMCPNEVNPFAGGNGRVLGSSTDTEESAVVYAGSSWPGCASSGKVLKFGDNSIELYATGGNDPSDPEDPSPCSSLDGTDPQAPPLTADGQEICSLDFIIEIRGGPGWFTGFDPDSTLDDAVGRSVTVFPAEIGPGTREIRVVVLASRNHLGEPFYHRVGSVDVFVENDPGAANNGQVEVITKAGAGSNVTQLFRVEGTGAVKANLEPVPLVNNVVGLPEPGAWLQLPAALAGLALLFRLRQRRRR